METLLAILSLIIVGLFVVYRLVFGGKLFIAWLRGNEKEADSAGEKLGGRTVSILFFIALLVVSLLVVVVECNKSF